MLRRRQLQQLQHEGGRCSAAPTPAQPPRRPPLRVVVVVVVESHQQALPHIHRRLRRPRGRFRRHARRRPTTCPEDDDEGDSREEEGGTAAAPPAAAARNVGRGLQVLEEWTLVHWDSHADLACPIHVPAPLCWRPHPETSTGDDDGDDDDDDDDPSRFTLYEHLEATPSGIAEWILPLVLGGSCANVEWIRPPPPPPSIGGGSAAQPRHLTQTHTVRNASFAAGRHSFRVGAWLPTTALDTFHDNTGASSPTVSSSSSSSSSSFLDVPQEARVRVDSHAPYYADDDLEDDVEVDDDEQKGNDDDIARYGGGASAFGCHAPRHELLCARPVELLVSYGGLEEDMQDDEHHDGAGDDPDGDGNETHEPWNADDNDEDWILDVCLDYFWCENPFWQDLHERNARVAEALTWLVTQSVLYGGDDDCSPPDDGDAAMTAEKRGVEGGHHNFVQERVTERRWRVRRFRQSLGRCLRASAAAAAAADEAAVHDTTEAPAVDLGTCVESTVPSNPIEPDLVRSLLSFYPERLEPKARETLDELRACLVEVTDASERESLVREGLEAIPYLTLPRDDGDPGPVIEARLHRFRQWLHRPSSTTGRGRRRAHTPMLITVARSAQDGFLPMEIVDDIQDKVIDLLHERYCGCPNRGAGRGHGAVIRPRPVGTREEADGTRRHGASRAVEDRACTLEVVLDYEYADERD